MKFLIGFVTFILCVAILAFGGYQTIMESDFEEMVEKIESVMESTPILPEKPDDNKGDDNNDDDNSGDIGGDIGGNIGGGDVDDDDDDDDEDDDDNTGDNNTGDNNTGDNNTGDNDTGDNNTGDNNTGDNTGDNNTGDNNTGDNTGDNNTGDDNTGDNTGDNNTGDDDTSDIIDNVSQGFQQDDIMDMVTNHNPITSDAKKETVSNSITNNLDTSTESGQLAADAGSVLTDHLFDKMDELKEENEDKTEEEKKEAEEKFAADTAAGINSALNIVGSASSGTTMEKEDLKNDFANVLESDVCVDSLNEITEDEEVKEKVQNVTANMDEETKNELKQQVQDKINENPEKEEDYKKLAESLGIPLDMIPEGGIPEGALPEGWPQQ